ncbi:MAG: hypothetical protein V3W34_00340 [Phycisphaerae bacterium]
MSRLNSIVAVVLLSSGVAYGQDQRGKVVSFFADVVSGDVVAQVPKGGFVLTDIFAITDTAIRLEQDDGATQEIKFSFLSGEPGKTEHSFESGIVFDAGTSIRFFHGGSGAEQVALSGYIPCSNPCNVPISFFADVVSGDVAAQVPTGGFVLTDIASKTTSIMWLEQDDGATQEIKLSLRPPNGGRGPHRLESGIVFDGGTSIRFFHGAPGTEHVTLSGYIPCSNPCNVPVPTVGEWGTFLMIVMILIGGSVVFARRRAVPA